MIRFNYYEKEGFAFVSFLVDTKNPILHSTSPRGNKFTNGSNFYVRYTEENCKSILLEIFGFGGVGNKNIIKEPCISGRNSIEYFSLNLSDFDNQEISYQFAVYDVTDKKTRSKFVKVRVDTTAPVINSIKYTQNRGYINLDINITEKNFDKAEYYDLNNAKARWKNLCTSLREGICKKRIRFVGTSPNILIRVLDEAGNSNETEMII